MKHNRIPFKVIRGWAFKRVYAQMLQVLHYKMLTTPTPKLFEHIPSEPLALGPWLKVRKDENGISSATFVTMKPGEPGEPGEILTSEPDGTPKWEKLNANPDQS